MKNRKDLYRRICLFWGVLGMLLCCGCNTRELEDRGFPLAIGIDKTEEGMVLSFDFADLSGGTDAKKPSGKAVSFSVEAGAYYEAQKAYENNTNKVLDYNHLKAIIIGQEFMADKQALGDLLSWLEHEEVVARNTCLFVAKEQAAEILTLTEDTGGSVGAYLEQMLETQEDFKENRIMTIGKLMNQWHNQNELLLIPVLSNNGNVPSITEYAAVDAFSYCGIISAEDAMKAFLCQGQLKQFLYHLNSGEVLQIENIKNHMAIQEMEGKTLVTIKLSGKASVKKDGENAGVTNRWLEKRLNEQLAYSLNQTAAELLEENSLDISNSYYKLGAYQRELYGKYQKDYSGYKENLMIQFLVEMEVINE